MAPNDARREVTRRSRAVASLGGLILLTSASAWPADSVRLGVPGALNSAASVAAEGARVVVTWAARTGTSTNVYAALSDDGGASFGAPLRVNDVEGDARASGEQPPRVSLGKGMDVVWESRAEGAAIVRAASLGQGARAFSPARTVHAAGLPGPRGWASLATDRAGAAHVVWLDGRDATAGQAIVQAVWWPDGTHDETTLAANVCFCCKTSVATGANGEVYAAWRHIYGPNLRDIAVARSTDGGRTFAAPVRVSEDHWAIDGCPDDGPSIGVDARGTVHVAWPTMLAADAPGKALFYSSSTDGGRTFAPRVRIDGDGPGSAHPQLAAAGERVAVVWEEGGNARRVWTREILGSHLGPPSMIGGDRPASYPAVAVTPEATIAVWTEEAADGSQIRVRRLAGTR